MNEWYEIEIRDPHNLAEGIFIQICDLLKGYLDLETTNIFTDYMEYTGPRMPSSKMSFKEYMEALKPVEQFIWADFFFIRNDNAFVPVRGMDYPEIIPETVVTMRAIDNMFVDIFTQDLKIKDLLEKDFGSCQVKKGKLDSFIYYY